MTSMTETQWRDRQLNDHLQGDPEPSRYWFDESTDRARDRDRGNRFASLRDYEREQEQIERDNNEASRPIWED